jgi:xanthine dehydrogenase YagR molybdenum-binding subunit
MNNAIGRPLPRTDARAKVTGAASYAADVPFPDMAYAALVTSPIARGRIRDIDLSAAEALEGVRLVLTHSSLNDKLGNGGFLGSGGRFQSSVSPLMSEDIAHHGQIVALVVADSQEVAEQAAGLLRIDYQVDESRADLYAELDRAIPLEALSLNVGDASAALADAPVSVVGEYLTAAMHQNPIELYSTTARWVGHQLHLDLPTQWVIGTQAGVADVLGVPRENVHVSSQYVGGGFGAKASVFWHTALTAIAARRVGRPVKLVVSRAQGFTVGSFRPETRQIVRLGASRDGRLLAYDHENWTQVSRADVSALPGTHYSTHIYAAPNIRAREFAVPTDVNTPGYMRAPLEYPANFAQESALDELASALGMDPIELRLRNEPECDPVSGVPYSSRSLIACFRRGAELFGWERRTAQPGSMRSDDGRLLGWGCASAWYPAYRAASAASVRVTADGGVQVRVGAHDLGTGTYTVLSQIAAEDLGIPVARVSVSLGSSDLPIGPMSAGSSTTASAGSAVRLACRKARAELLAMARDVAPFAGRDCGRLEIADGSILGADGSTLALNALVAGLPGGAFEVVDQYAPRELSEDQVRSALDGRLAQAGPFGDTHTMFSFGAQFAEVQVDPLTLHVTLGRLVGVFACGRIINPRTARNQLAGGMIWGAGHALMEEGVFDRRRARFANNDLDGYHFAVNADVSKVVVEMIDEDDDVVNPLGAKGVGETGVVGMAPAIANAIHHATGVRVRRTPILVDSLLEQD